MTCASKFDGILTESISLLCVFQIYRKVWIIDLKQNQKPWIWFFKISQTGATVSCLNPRGLSAFIYTDIYWTCPAARQDLSRLKPSSQAWGKHYTHLLTTVVTYLINKLHCQAPDSADATPLLFGIWLHRYPFSSFSVPLFWVLSSSTILPATYHFISYIPHSSRPLTELPLFIMPLWQFKIKLHFCTDWAPTVRAGKTRSFPFGFPVSHGIDGSAWSALKRLTFCLSITLRGDCE